MCRPLISVIVPVYRVEPYLEKCVQSICAQTYRNLEIILVDDGSPDRCGDMCDELAKKDSRIRVIHKENGGLSDARNAGLDAMTGDYVGFVDSDDWIEPNMYEVLYQQMSVNKAQISCCGMKYCTDQGVKSFFNPNTSEHGVLSTVNAQKELIRNVRITNSVCDKLFSAQIFDSLRLKKGILYEDLQIQPYCIAKASWVAYTAEPLYCYYLSPVSLLRGNYSVRQFDCIRVSRECIRFYDENFPGISIDARIRHIELLLGVFCASYNIPEWKELQKELKNEVRQTAKSVKAEKQLSKKLRIKLGLFRLSDMLYVKVAKYYQIATK